VSDRGPGSPWSSWVDRACEAVAAAGQWRQPRTFDALGPTGRLDPGGGGPEVPGTPSRVVSFASNDYLGLSSHPDVVDAAHRALDRWGAGSGASRLVTGSRPVHDELEAALASWKECERAVLLPTGFAANLSVLSVFGTEGARVFSDGLNHASIIDGCRLARAPVTIYPHGDLGALDAALGAAGGRSVVVSDTVFSMDGDAADLEGLMRVARRHQALLVLDEAHAVLGPELPPMSGTGGPGGRGVDVLRVGTLSKTLGSLGGFVAGPARFIELLVNRARPYIFTTAPTPADAAAALAAVGIVQSTQGALLRARLAGHVSRVATAVDGARVDGARVDGSRVDGSRVDGSRVDGTVPCSPIVPMIIGDESDAVAASGALAAQGLWVPAIRPPTVPPGTSRLRITLSAAHTDDQVDRLVAGLGALTAVAPGRGSRAS
jgi:8-amino-7-oxononanoate synthase